MSNIQYHPIQKLCYINRSNDIGCLLAAIGPSILSIDLKSGGVISKWPDESTQLPTGQNDKASQNGLLHARVEGEDQPNKRRKLSPSHDEGQSSPESSVSIEFVSERSKGQRRKKKKVVETPSPNVSHLTSTTDGRHVIAATAEDKCIRVFELDSEGRLKPLSERQGMLDLLYIEFCLQEA
jgi:tRNA (guanine-N(7)-)-methyltransferase subunit TRM82